MGHDTDGHPDGMIGSVIGDYRIVALLGSGGSAEVWEAEHIHLGKRFALKLQIVPPPSELELNRFLNEARRAIHLDHSGIARVFNASLIDGKRPFIVYELIEGLTISRRLKTVGRLDPREAIRITREAATALAYAHSQGILHRDISSNNVMVTSTGRVVIVDFGLARHESPDVTHSVGLRGTPGFIAPELLDGAEASRSSDIFGLGAVLFHMLTGRVPRSSGEPDGSLSHALPGAPASLERCAQKALAKDPARRYASGEDFARDLKSIRFRDPNTLWRLAAAGLASIALIALLAGDLPVPRVGMQSLAILSPVDLSEDPGQGHLLPSNVCMSVATALERLPQMRVTPWRTSIAFTSPVAAASESLHCDAFLHGSFRLSNGEIQLVDTLSSAKDNKVLWTVSLEGRYEDYLTLVRRLALDLAAKWKGPLSSKERAIVESSIAHQFTAYVDYLRGAAAFQTETPDSTDRSFSLFQEARSADSTLAEAYIGMGLVHTRRYFRGWFSGGEGALETARQEFRRAIALDPRSGEARGGLVRTLWEKGRSVECLQLLKEIPAENAENFTDLMVRGEGYVLSGLSERAIPYLEHTTEVDHDSDWAAWMLTLAYAFSERYRDATVAGKRFLARFGDDREILHWLSLSQFALGEVWEAEASCRQEIEAGPSSIGDNDGRYNLFAGCLLDKLGKQEEAKKAWAEGLQTVDERLIAQSDNLRMHALRAAFCVLLGKEQQLASEQRLLFQDLGRSGYGENMMFFALALAKRGKSDEAARILRGAAAARVVSPYTFLFRHPAFKADVESGDHSGQVRAALAELESVTKSVNSAF